MNVVVTGGGGYVGSVLVRGLLKRGWCVRAIDEFLDGDGCLASLQGRVEVIYAAPEEIHPRWLRDADAVVHLGGLAQVPLAATPGRARILADAAVTERLLQTCRGMKVPRLTIASPCDLAAGLIPERGGDEDGPLSDGSCLATSRPAIEKRLCALADDEFCLTILRQATPYGWSPRPALEHAPNRFVLDAVTLGRVTLPSNAWVTQPFVDVQDLAEAHIRCLEAPSTRVRGQVFDVVHANLSLREAAAIVAGAVSEACDYVRLITAEIPWALEECRCDPERLPAALGFKPRRSLEVSVLEMVRHLTGQGESPQEMPVASSQTRSSRGSGSLAPRGKCGMRNAECGAPDERMAGAECPSAIPHSAFRIPHSASRAGREVAMSGRYRCWVEEEET